MDTEPFVSEVPGATHSMEIDTSHRWHRSKIIALYLVENVG